MKEIISRSAMLIGEEAVKKLENLHIAVFGLGGVGSYLAESLARSGVGELTLIDNDTVSLSNINRQLYALHSTVGKLKTEVARDRIADINPDCKVNIISDFYLPENAEKFFIADYDYVADAIDTVTAKIDLVCRCKEKNIPIISCMCTGNKFLPEMLKTADIYKTSGCPLCRVMRRELKNRGIKSLKVVYSEEPPKKPTAIEKEDARKAIPGSMSYVPSVAGLLMCAEIINTYIF